MNACLFSSIQSAAYGNLFECSTHEERGHDVVFSSMSHENEVGVMDDGEELLFASLLNTEGLTAKFPKLATEDGLVVVKMYSKVLLAKVAAVRRVRDALLDREFRDRG